MSGLAAACSIAAFGTPEVKDRALGPAFDAANPIPLPRRLKTPPRNVFSTPPLVASVATVERSFLGPLLWIPMAMMSPGKPGGFNGHKPTDKRQIRDQETADRELFHKDRARFNIKQRQDYERQQKARDGSKEAKEAKTSRAEKQERFEARDAAARQAEEAMEAAREFNERREAEREPPEPSKQL
jgi:hypothetical protein